MVMFLPTMNSSKYTIDTVVVYVLSLVVVMTYYILAYHPFNHLKFSILELVFKTAIEPNKLGCMIFP